MLYDARLIYDERTNVESQLREFIVLSLGCFSMVKNSIDDGVSISFPQIHCIITHFLANNSPVFPPKSIPSFVDFY